MVSPSLSPLSQNLRATRLHGRGSQPRSYCVLVGQYLPSILVYGLLLLDSVSFSLSCHVSLGNIVCDVITALPYMCFRTASLSYRTFSWYLVRWSEFLSIQFPQQLFIPPNTSLIPCACAAFSLLPEQLVSLIHPSAGDAPHSFAVRSHSDHLSPKHDSMDPHHQISRSSAKTLVFSISSSNTKSSGLVRC